MSLLIQNQKNTKREAVKVVTYSLNLSHNIKRELISKDVCYEQSFYLLVGIRPVDGLSAGASTIRLARRCE